MEFKDYYKILGVAADADAKAIKTAYRKLARQYHPDVSTEADAEAHFKEVTEAYEALRDPARRSEYDELRKYAQGRGFKPPPDWQPHSHAETDGFYESDFSDFFNSIFGGGRQQGFTRGRTQVRQRGQDVELDLPVFLEETLNEEQKTITAELPRINSQGHREMVRKTLKVKIPRGVTDGERIRLKGQGGPGYGGGDAGDLYLCIRLVPHPLFDVEGHNLVLTLPVAPWEAALGAKVVIPTLDGDVNLTIPANSQTGQRLRVKSRGLFTPAGRGDLLVQLKVVMPSSSDERIKQHWRALAESAAFNPRKTWRKS